MKSLRSNKSSENGAATRPWQRLRGCLCAVMMWGIHPVAALAEGGMLTVTDNDALMHAVEDGTSAQATLVLDPGAYGPVTFLPGQAPAVIRSADPTQPAQINGILVNQFNGLTIEGVVFRYHYTPGDRLNLRPFSFSSGHGLVLQDITFAGDLAHETSTVDDGYPTGIGLSVRFSEDIRIEDNLFTQFHRGMAISESRDIVIAGNEMTGIRMDGMVFAQVEDLVIERNLIHSFDRALTSDDHADMIQFWTASTNTPSRNITIRNNVLHSGYGAFTQSIFINNELVARGTAGEEMYYRNILIEENVIINAQLHGITVGETIGLTIRRNTLAQNPRSAGGPSHERGWYPAIRISEVARDVVVEGNISGDDRGYTHNPNWRVADNLLIQNQFQSQPNHYSAIFTGWPEGDPRLLETYRYAIPLSGVGASLLRF